MANLDQTKHVIDKAVNMMGGLDFLVLNHVMSLSTRSLWNGSTSDLEYVKKSVYINYLSYVYLSTHSTPYLTKSNGHLIVVSSLAVGHFLVVFATAYGSSKAAVNHFFANLRMEMALQDKYDYSITICLLGVIETEKEDAWNKYLDKTKVKQHPLVDTAQEIIRAGATRSAYVFIPKWTVIAGIQRAFTTDTLDKILLKMVHREQLFLIVSFDKIVYFT